MEKKIAKILLDIKAVTLSPHEPFTWASGIKSPIYCDNRLLLSYPHEWNIITEAMVEILKKEFPDADGLMGTATAGIPHASVCAYKMSLPSGFVRSSAKDHGTGNKIEGKIFPGMKVVVIEDLISTGGSSISAVNALLDAGCDVLGVLAIFTYGMKKAEETMKQVKTLSLTSYQDLIPCAVEEKYINNDDVEKLKKFMGNPSDDSWMES